MNLLPDKENPAVVSTGDVLELAPLLPDNSVDAVACDPPYEIGFMGRAWDSSGVAFSVETWRQVWRILKPGGYLLAFGATRTYHRMACAIEDAGFEIRDSLHWIYGSGFPKSHDIAKGIDRARNDYEDACRVALWLRPHIERVGFERVTAHFGFRDNTMTRARWTTTSQPQVPRWEQWEVLKAFCDLPADMDAEVWRLNGRKGQPGEAWHDREQVGERDLPDTTKLRAGFTGPNHSNPDHAGARRMVPITTAASEPARRWEGWGTALKPAHEPIVVARKPFPNKTVAENVLEWGTGGLNIDACRIFTDDDTARARSVVGDTPAAFGRGYAMGGNGSPLGRWPSNVLLDSAAADALDLQSGTTRSGQNREERGTGGIWQEGNGVPCGPQYGDEGGASRFFSVFDYDDRDIWPFLYMPKPSQTERDIGTEEGNPHETVKPVSLMAWILRLVTPPCGIVLDPFVGSGTTLVAARGEGFLCAGFEIRPEVADVARARVAASEQTVAGELLRRRIVRGRRPRPDKPTPQGTMNFESEDSEDAESDPTE